MSESLETAFGDAAQDPASDIAVAVMSLKWAQGGDADEHGDRYGQIQEIADPIIQAALSQARADALAQGRREGLIQALDTLACHARASDAYEAIEALATAPAETQKPETGESVR